jgi:hypothetical protein
LLFGVLRPVECGAYSSGVSEKQKNESFLCGRACRAVALAEAGASAVTYYSKLTEVQNTINSRCINFNL